MHVKILNQSCPLNSNKDEVLVERGRTFSSFYCHVYSFWRWL